MPDMLCACPWKRRTLSLSSHLRTSSMSLQPVTLCDVHAASGASAVPATLPAAPPHLNIEHPDPHLQEAAGRRSCSAVLLFALLSKSAYHTLTTLLQAAEQRASYCRAVAEPPAAAAMAPHSSLRSSMQDEGSSPTPLSGTPSSCCPSMQPPRSGHRSARAPPRLAASCTFT